MDDQAKVITRDWLVTLLGIFVIAGALVALCFPVYLDSYDSWGMKVKCGTGYSSQLLQATIDDQDAGHPSPPGGAATTSGAATNYTDQCKNALAHRRAWTIAIAGLGVLALVPELLAWARGGSPGSPASTPAGSASDAALHLAALLDRRGRSRRPRSSNTTL